MVGVVSHVRHAGLVMLGCDVQRIRAQEMKKLRTQRRLQREQDKLLLIRQGLLEPPKPKVLLTVLLLTRLTSD